MAGVMDRKYTAEDFDENGQLIRDPRYMASAEVLDAPVKPAPPKIERLDQAVRLSRILRKEGAKEQLGDRYEAGIAALRNFEADNPGFLQPAILADMRAQQAPQEPQQQEQKQIWPANMGDPNRVPGQGTNFEGKLLWNTSISDLPGMALDTAIGLVDNTKTFVGGAVGEIAGGAIAAGYMGVVSGWEYMAGRKVDMPKVADDAANIFNSITDGVGYITQPWTDQGKEQLEAIARPMMFADKHARNLSEYIGHGDPFWSAAAYTTLMGATELAGVKGIHTNSVRALPRAQAARIKKLADDMGIIPTQGDMTDSIVAAAQKMSSAERAAAHPALRDALVESQRVAKMQRDQLAEAARGTYAAMKAGDLAELGKGLDAQLRIAGYDLVDMKAARSVLDDLMAIQKESPLTGKRQLAGQEAAAAAESSNLILPGSVKREAAQVVKQSADEIQAGLDEVWTIRNRVEKAYSKDPKLNNLPESQNQNKVLKIIERSIDDMLETQYAQGMMSGSPEALQAWQQATAARQYVNSTFNENRFIAKLVDLEATPIELRAALTGKSATAPAAHAVRTIRKLKEILGREHPSFKGIQNDYVHEMVQPLLEDIPNLDKFIRNYDSLVVNNADLVRELNLDLSGLRELRDFAHTARKLPPKHPLLTREFFASIAARTGFGHAIAIAGMKVGIAKRIFGALLGKDVVKQKQILADVTMARYGEPAIPRGTALFETVVQSAIVADAERLVEQKRK